MQIRTKLIIWFLAVVSGLLLIAFCTIYLSQKFYTEQDFYDRLKKKALLTADLLIKVEKVDRKILKQIEKLNRRRNVLPQENILIYNYQKKIIFQSNDTVCFELDDPIFKQIRLRGEYRFQQGEHQLVGLVYKDQYNRILAIAGAIDQDGKAYMNRMLTVMTWLFIFMIVVVGFSGWFFSERVLRPISEIIIEVEKVFPQNLSKRLTNTGKRDEIAKLTNTFNKLLDRIEHAFRVQNTFVSNVSHELKNPLTRIASQLEVKLLKERSADDYQQTLSSVLDDVRELSQMTSLLLELAKVNDQQQTRILSQIRLDELIWEARDWVLASYQHYKIKVHFGEDILDDDHLTIAGNAQLLKTAFINLMENGCKFSDERTVEIWVDGVQSRVQVRFENRGKTIEPKDLPYIFQPFYRAENTADRRGYGIGLSLVERIIGLHKGEIMVQSSEGLTHFDVRLPYLT
jgi:signal transduction histidine kinase